MAKEPNQENNKKPALTSEQRIRLAELRRRVAAGTLSDEEAQELEILRQLKDEALLNQMEKDQEEVVNSAPEKNLKKLKNVTDEKKLYAMERDTMRYANKAMLRNLSGIYWGRLGNMITNIRKDPMETDPELKERKLANIAALRELLKQIADYSNMDVTAIEGSLREEVKIYKQITKGLNDLEDMMIDQELGQGAYERKEGEQLTGSEEMDDVHRMITNMLTYFEGQVNGNLEVDPGAKNKVNAVGMKIKRFSFTDFDISKADSPLFPHDPSYNDIVQGRIGDCYMVSSLSAIAINHADKIKEAMCDNGDGTVTVRFWKKVMSKEGPDTGDTYEPVFVTVDKVTPFEGSADGSVWVQTLERAYAASGLYVSGRQIPPSMRNYTEQAGSKKVMDWGYNTLKDMDENDLPAPFENPHLIDKDGKLHKYAPSYGNIDGGQSGSFIEHLLGADYQYSELNTGNYNLLNDKTPVFFTYLHVQMEMLDESFPDAPIEVIEDIKEDLNYGDLSLADVCYKMLAGDVNATVPRTQDGKLDKEANENALIAATVEEFIGNHGDAIAKSGASRLDLRGLFKKLEEEINNPDTLSDKKYKDSLDKIMGDDKHKEAFKNLLEKFEKQSEKAFTDFKSHKQYSGEYNRKEMEFLNKVEDALAKGLVVTMSSKPSEKGEGDKYSTKGLVHSHAYAVTGIKRENVNGKEHIFIKYRNPHATNVRKYSFDKDGKLSCDKEPKNSDGEGMIELGDAVKELSRITINGPINEKPVIHEKVKEPIRVDTLSKYWRALNSIKNELQTSGLLSNNSEEYKTLLKSMDHTMMNLASYRGKDMSRLYRSMRSLVNYTDKYLNHCAKNQKTGNVRETRMRACDSIKILYGMAKAQEKNPRERELNVIAEKMSLYYLEKDKKVDITNPDKQQLDSMVSQLRSKAAFKNTFGKKGFAELAQLNKSGNEKLIAEFKQAINERNMQHNSQEITPIAEVKSTEPVSSVEKSENTVQMLVN